VEELGGVGGFALDAEQDVEGGGARGGDGHGFDCSFRLIKTAEDAGDAEGFEGTS